MIRSTHVPSATLSLLLGLGLAAPGCDDECGYKNACASSTSATESGGTTSIPLPETTGDGMTTTTSTVTGIPTTSTTTDATDSGSTGSTTEPTPRCGDGELDEGEECDDGDGNNGPGKACNAECMLNVCGDMDQGPGEACDDGNTDNTDACVEMCVKASCGDGFVEAGVEECDDGNGEDLDGCSAACTIERIVFASSGVYTGNAAGLNGLGGADAICQSLAESVKLTANGQTFRAWLSAGRKSPASDPARFPEAVTSAKGPFLLPDANHTKIADDWDDLTSGDIAHAIDTDESGTKFPNLSLVWTNTTALGTPAGKGDCSAWQLDPNDANATGGVGVSNQVNSDWTNRMNTTDCVSPARIYCFQVTP